MRSAKAEDYWRHSQKRQYTSFIQNINLNGHCGINFIPFSGAIDCICGLNGAGKSTIIAALKDTIGLPLSKQDEIKINGNYFDSKIKINNQIYECKNTENERLIDKITDLEQILYIDFEQTLKALKFLSSQENIEELIEQNDERKLAKEELEEINYLGAF